MLAATVVWLAPNAMGGNAVRLGALFGGPVLAAVVLARRPRVAPWFLALALAGGLYWQLTASVTQIARSVGDPSTARRATSTPPPTGCARTAARGCGSRCRRPPTTGSRPTWRRASSSPAAGCASSTPPATTSSTTTSELTDATYSAWLRRNAISYVALPDAAARLLLGRRAPADPRRPALPRPALQLAALADLRGARPEAAGRAARRRRGRRRCWVGRQGFALDVDRPGEFLVRVNFTPYWSIARGAGCILRRGDWTVARAAHPGVFRVAADFSLGRAWNAVTGARKTC